MPVPVGPWSKYGGHDLTKELARLCDDLGSVRRRLVRRAARRVFGRSEYALAMFYRWSSNEHVFDAMIRVQFTAAAAAKPPRVRRRAVRPGLWDTAAAPTGRDLATLQALERQLCRIYAVGGLRVVEPGIVTRRQRLRARWLRAVRWVGELREPIATLDRPAAPIVSPPGSGAVVQLNDVAATPTPHGAEEEGAARA